MQRAFFPASRGLVAAIAVLAVAAAAVTAAARPAYFDDRSRGSGDPRNVLWEPKQAAFEELQEALSAPWDAARATQEDFDARYYFLDIEIDDGAGSVAGSVTMRATSNVDGLTTVLLDLYDNMTVDSVMSQEGLPLSYSHNNDILTVTLGSTVDTGQLFELEIFYHGFPINDALTFDTHGGGYPIVSSLSEPSGARQWWPCKDTPADKADSARVAITVDDALTAVSNGLLDSVTDNGSTKTYTWVEDYPITTYLISVAISNYSHWTDYYVYSRGTMPIENYVYPEILAAAQEDLDITAAAIGAFAGMYGEYPFVEEKYGHAIFPWGGAMEHQTCTSYGRVLIRGDHYYDWILVHELSHQWWGDWVTCETWDDVWLNEGFASYSEALWFESLGGSQEYHDYVDGYDYYGYFDGPIYHPDATFNRTVYDKGALVLHMLRRVLALADGAPPNTDFPAESLFDVLDSYGTDNSYGTATTAEFQSYCEAKYGSSMDWFFQEWIYGENRPDYEWSWVASDQGPPYEVMLHVDQVQSDAGLFTMPIDIQVETATGDTFVTIWNDQWSQDFFFSVDDLPTDVNFDPADWVLKNANEVTTGVQHGGGALALQTPANPSGPGARLTFTMPQAGHVDLRVYDVSGRLVTTLVDRDVAAGSHSAVWNGRSDEGGQAASGVYFLRLSTGRDEASAKLVLLR